MGSQLSISGIYDLYNAGVAVDQSRTAFVVVHIYVDTYAERDMVLAVRDALLPETPNSEVRVRALYDKRDIRGPRPDVGVIIAGGSDKFVSERAQAFAELGTPVVIVAETLLDIPSFEFSEALMSRIATIVASKPQTMVRHLARWLVDATDKGTAFSANFPFCRKERASRLVRDCAKDNAASGISSLKSSDTTPVNTGSLLKLSLDVAAAYGKPMGPARIPELLGVLGAGLGYKALANSISGIAPGSGLLVRGGLGYAETYLSGHMVMARFEATDGNGPTLAERFMQIRSLLDRLPHNRLAAAAPGPEAGLALAMPVAQGGGM